jgi:vibriolysin
MKKKKSVFKSNILFTFTLVFVVCCFMATSSWAARKIEFCQANANGYIKQLNENKSLEHISIGKTLGLSQDEELTLLRKKTDFNGVTHYRCQQAHQGIPVWGMQTVVSVGPDNQVVRLHGTMVLDIAGDIKNIPPVSSLDPGAALRQMQENHKTKNKGAAWHFRNEQYGTYIYIDKKQKAHTCYVVSFFADSESGNPSRFIYFIDVNTGGVLYSFDGLTYAEGTGPGGNLKIGYYEYGSDYPGFGVTEDNGLCTMITPNVITVDLEHKAQGTTPYSYTCYRNTHEAINGGYCPLNDAQYYGQAAYDMYKNWYGVILPFSPLRLRCHYKKNYDGAFWDGSTLTIGDGHVIYYPLVSVDTIVHEFSHGFTEYNSDLIYSGQSGGINESFSDMSGEAAIYYMRGVNHFMVQYEIYKDPDEALRYLCDPPLDGHSIDHVDDYYSGMDVHYSSGIFNKAFYLIATSTGWTTRMAFDIFIKANMDYWTPSTNFQQGAECALYAALDYGYPCEDVRDAFARVGIPLTCPRPPAAD